jgi:hypothetical protein
MINLYLYQYVKLVTPIYCYHWIFIFHHLLKWLNLLLPLAIHFSPLAQVTQLTVTIGYSFFTSCSSDSMYCSIWPFVFHHLLKWLNLLFPFDHSFFTICSSDSIYCSHLTIRFSPLAQVTQFTVPIWPFIFHHLLKWLNLLFPFGHSFFTIYSSDSIYCYHWPFIFHYLLKWPNLLFPFGHSFFITCSSNPIYCSIWPFVFHHLLKWLKLLFPFGHSFFTIYSSDSIYCSHLAIPFSLFTQVTQFTVPIWSFIYHHLLK